MASDVRPTKRPSDKHWQPPTLEKQCSALVGAHSVLHRSIDFDWKIRFSRDKPLRNLPISDFPVTKFYQQINGYGSRKGPNLNKKQQGTGGVNEGRSYPKSHRGSNQGSCNNVAIDHGSFRFTNESLWVPKFPGLHRVKTP